MLELLLGEVGDLDQLAGEVLGDRRQEPTVAAPDVAAAVQSAARTVAVARGATVRVQAGPQAEVEASPTMLRQAIENLIDNAAAHGGPGGVEVDVRADPAAGQVEVVVADRGGAGGPGRARHRAVRGPPVPGGGRRELVGCAATAEVLS